MGKMSSPISGRSSDSGRKTKSYKGGTGQRENNGEGAARAARNGSGTPGNAVKSAGGKQAATTPAKKTPVHTSGTPGAFVHK